MNSIRIFAVAAAVCLVFAGPAAAQSAAGGEEVEGLTLPGQAQAAPKEKEAAAEQSALSPPHAVLPERVHDFGEVDPEEKVSYDFAIRNAGDSELVIQKVQPG